MEKVISNLCEFFIRQQIIQAADKEVYQYCFEVLAMKLIYYAGCIAIMWHYQCFLLPIIFIATHTVLRSYMGGWHAANMWVCLFSSLLLFTAMVNLFLYAGLPAQGKLLCSAFSMIIAALVMHHFGMQDHPNRKLTEDEKAAAEKNFFRIFLVSLFIMLLAIGLQQVDIAFSMALAYSMATFLLLLAKLKKEGNDTP